eukprot:4281986-Prymnesium_polylepis.1
MTPPPHPPTTHYPLTPRRPSPTAGSAACTYATGDMVTLPHLSRSHRSLLVAPPQRRRPTPP